MPTLVIHAPKRTADQGSRNFENTFASGIGDDYAIYQNLFVQLKPGCSVILLSKDERKQAEGELLDLMKRGAVTANGIQRYDVHIGNLKRVDYRGDGIRLNRCGVAVI